MLWFLTEAQNVSFSLVSSLTLESTQPTMHQVTVVLSPGKKQPRCKAVHWPSSAEIKNEWCYTSAFPYACMVCTDTTLTLLLFTAGLSQALVQLVQGILSLGVKQVEYEADP